MFKRIKAKKDISKTLRDFIGEGAMTQNDLEESIQEDVIGFWQAAIPKTASYFPSK